MDGLSRARPMSVVPVSVVQTLHHCRHIVSTTESLLAPSYSPSEAREAALSDKHREEDI